MNRRLTTLIVDDEAPARQRLRSMLRHLTDVNVVAEASDVDEAADQIDAHRPDLVLLDVQMPGKSGFELLPACAGPHAPIVIFITAFERHAVRAFEVAALDYLLKPVAFTRLQAAVERARLSLRTRDAEASAADMALVIQALRQSASAPQPPNAYLAELWVQRRGEHLCVPVSRIDWIAAERDYVRLHAGPESHLLRETIGRLEQQLDPDMFVRVHRSAIVRRARIAAVRQGVYGALSAVLSDGTELPVGRSYAGRVRSLYHSSRH